MLNVAEYNKLICHDPCTDWVAQPKNNYFELGNIFVSESQFIKSSLLINGFCWLSYPGLGVIIILREECVECDRERLLWSSADLISWPQVTIPRSCQSPRVWPGSKMWWETDTGSFYFLRTCSFCEDDTIDLLKRVDSIQTQRPRGQESWIALKKLEGHHFDLKRKRQ